jgi:drug/metabolite transporter (DMT)-like permease
MLQPMTEKQTTQEGHRARFAAMPVSARAAAYVSFGSLMLVVMATVVKFLGDRFSSFELMFFRSILGFLFVLPLFARDPMEPFRTRRQGMHFIRGLTSTFGNGCFFWTITHMMLADSMALQFSRPLFMIPLAILFLGEKVPLSRTMVSIVGFVGILFYARPFTSGFDANALVGALGALGGALVVVSIKQLARTEPTRVIMFYYAFWNAVFALIPTVFIWVQPQGWEWALLTLIGFLGISGQWMITKGLTLGDASALAPLDYSRIVYAAVLGFILFGEIPGVWSFVGMGIIVAASIYLVMTEKKRAA